VVELVLMDLLVVEVELVAFEQIMAHQL